MGSESLLTFAEIAKVPGEYRNAEWPSRLFKVDAAGDVFVNDAYAPGNWNRLNPSPAAWGTPEREFYPEPQKEPVMHQVYEDRYGRLYYEVAPGVWLFDANRVSLNTKGQTCGVIVPGYTVDRSQLTPLDGVRLGFYGTPKPRPLTYAEILRNPGVYEDVDDPDTVVTVNSIGQAFRVTTDGRITPCDYKSWGASAGQFKPSSKKIEVK